MSFLGAGTRKTSRCVPPILDPIVPGTEQLARQTCEYGMHGSTKEEHQHKRTYGSVREAIVELS